MNALSLMGKVAGRAAERVRGFLTARVHAGSGSEHALPVSIALLAATLLFAAAAWPQEFRATLTGRVTDPSGAPIPGVSVVVTQTDTNLLHRAVTTETGDYTIPFLPPGRYRLEVDRTGFRRFVRDGLSLQVQDRVKLDVVLELGTQTEAVTVTGETPLIETASASLGQVVSSQTIQDIPLNGRNAYELMITVPGVTTTARDNTIYFMRYSAAGDSGGIAYMSISGAPSTYNEYLLDGVPTTSDNAAVVYVPSVEATQEFRLHTNLFDTQFGRFLGGVVNASTRSGANQVHGTAFDFVRNSYWNARDFFAVTKPKFAYNQFGASLSGPVYIPGVYKAKDRTFFFVLYDGSREGVARSWVSTVPTEAQRSGDFSQTFTRVAGQPTPVTIYDPTTSRLVGNTYARDPFPGNVIPANRQNAVGKAFLSFYPMPSATGDAVTHINNFPLSYTDPVLDNGVITKLDHRFGDRHQMFVRFFWRHFYVRGGGEFLNGATSRGVNRYTPGAALGETFTLNPTTVLDLRYGFSRYKAEIVSDSYGFNLASLGWPASLISAIDVPSIPQVSASGYTAFGSFNLARTAGDSHFVHATVSKQLARHALRTGFDVRLYRHTSGPGGTTPGLYTFDGAWTRGPNPQVTTAIAGNAAASMLLGLSASGRITYQASLARQAPYYEMFLQDDIRLARKLTLNLGVRYEWEGGHTERFNRFNRGFDFNAASPIEAQAVANYALNPIPEVPVSAFRVKGGLLFAGQGGLPRTLTDIDRNNVSPRVGFAYSPTPKTALRGGYGHFFGPTLPQYYPGQVSATGDVTPSYGFTATTTQVTSLGEAIATTLSNPFPSGIARPAGGSPGLSTQLGQAVGFVNPQEGQPWTQQFQFGIQRQLPGAVVVETAYSGSRTNDYAVTRSLNVIPREIQAQARQNFIATNRNYLSDAVRNPFYGLIDSGGLSLATTSRNQLMLPYPHFTSVSKIGENAGSMKYDSFQLKVNKRFVQGLSFLASYTASKLLDTRAYLNSNDPEPSRRLSTWDSPQRFVLTGSYALPFGKGRRHFANARGLAGKLIQGWQANTVYTAQSGVPVSISSGESVGRSAWLPNDQRSLSRWFDTSAFRLRQTLEFAATSLLPDVRTHGTSNFNLSLHKNTYLFEQVRLQFRAEAFNLFNRAAFGAPGGGAGTASFGVISSQVNFSRQLQFALKLLW